MQIPAGVDDGEKMPATLLRMRANMQFADILCLDNGGSSGTGYWKRSLFALQLQGPFSAGMLAGSHLILLSGQPFRRVLVLFIVFNYRLLRL